MLYFVDYLNTKIIAAADRDQMNIHPIKRLIIRKHWASKSRVLIDTRSIVDSRFELTEL